jgi:hypothetical protein
VLSHTVFDVFLKRISSINHFILYSYLLYLNTIIRILLKIPKNKIKKRDKESFGMPMYRP